MSDKDYKFIMRRIHALMVLVLLSGMVMGATLITVL